MHYATTPSCSTRKRQRLSSPTYDEHFIDLSQEDIDALNKLEPQLYQLSNENKDGQAAQTEQAPSPDPHPAPRLLSGLQHDPDNPFSSSSEHTNIGQQMANTGFKPAFTLATHRPPATTALSRSPSPEVPPEHDYSSWFTSDNSISNVNETAPLALFQTAKIVAATPVSAPRQSILANTRFITPSDEGLKKAREKIRAWQEDDSFDEPTSPRPVLQSVANVSDLTSDTSQTLPSQVPGFSRAGGPLPTAPRLPLEAGRSKLQQKPKPFKSPLLTAESKHELKSKLAYTNSPLNPHHPATAAFTKASHHHLASAPLLPSVGKPQLIPRAARGGRSAKPNFVTPFKPGMRPGEPGRTAHEDKSKASRPSIPITSPPAPVGPAGKITSAVDEANPSAPKGRTTLKSCGLMPQAYTPDELEKFGINVLELSQITPALALYYSFHTPSSGPLTLPGPERPSKTDLLGPMAALSELQKRGCDLTTKEWVENHWGLILWKLAGMVALDPEREVVNGGENKRWCWEEVIKQLLYRYKREFESAQRPALRLITTQDAPASSPLVLCVSGIFWSEGSITDEGERIEPHPELEVTDGWYRLKAQIDGPLARAVKNGILRIGRKIGTVGAKLSTERKEPLEILEAYNTTKLVITANSSQLSSWHAKLGFQSGLSPVSTMHKLTPDGGRVAVMDLVVVKVHPFGFLEIIEEDDGKKRKDRFWNESEETRLMDKWRAKREAEASKIRANIENKMAQIEGWAEKLERQAGNRFKPTDDDSPPDHIENVCDDLEEATDVGSIFAGLNATEAGWLARHIKEKTANDRERIMDEIESELNHICPPRKVRDFCVLIVRDACTHRRPAHRQAQLTVWDAIGLTVAESGEKGAFKQGQRFRVTNLFPQQAKAWMGREEGAEIFLSTTRNSRWTRIQ